jgi:hypothetical protein
MATDEPPTYFYAFSYAAQGNLLADDATRQKNRDFLVVLLNLPWFRDFYPFSKSFLTGVKPQAY